MLGHQPTPLLLKVVAKGPNLARLVGVSVPTDRVNVHTDAWERRKSLETRKRNFSKKRRMTEELHPCPIESISLFIPFDQTSYSASRAPHRVKRVKQKGPSCFMGMAMESITRPLYGGMVELLVPQSMTDVSDYRPVPDHQEVFSDGLTDQSLIVEIVE